MVNVDDLQIAMRAAIDPAGLMQRVADQTLELVGGANGVLIGLADRQGVSYVWGSGVAETSIGTRVSMDSSLSGFAIRMRQVSWSDDCETDPRVDREVARRISVASAVCVPLTRGNEVLGVRADAHVGSPYVFYEGDVDTLTNLASYVCSAIALARDLARVSNELLELATS
jgi:GAF domain-containing protein